MLKNIILFSTALFLLASPSFAIPNIQLFVDGIYDTATETWVVTDGTFDIYVIGANGSYSDIYISMALGFAKSDNPNGTVSVDVDGTTYNSWEYGYAPLATVATWDHSDDLAKHGIFPAWFTEFNAGSFGQVGGVGDVQPDPTYWNPATEGYLASAKAQGEIKVFSIEVTGTAYLHFDAYTENADGSIADFAPFSHDAALVPEPTSLALFGIGLIGYGIRRRFKK